MPHTAKLYLRKKVDVMLRNQKIGVKLSAGFGIIITLSIIMSVFAVYSLGSISGGYRDLINYSKQRTQIILTIGQKVMNIRRITTAVNAWTGHVDRQEASRTESAAIISDINNDIDRYIGLVRNDNSIAEEQKITIITMAEQLRTLMRQYHRDLIVPNIEFAILNDREAVRANATAQGWLISNFQAKMTELTEIEQGLTSSLVGQMRERAAFYRNGFIVIASITVVVSILLAFIINRFITRPLKTIVTLAERAADGDLTITKADFGYDSRDEMGNMVTALSNMIDAQDMALSKIVHIAEELAGGACNLSAISEQTNAAMEEVKGSVVQVGELSKSNGSALEETNAGIEEMSAGADTVAHSATDSAAFIAQTTDASNKAIKTVNSVIDGMRNVNANSKESEAKTRQLVASVENVSSFVSVITGIADQTNLLALNAAIEAARAGEVGRGFAVVAEEVRKLAEESARAAQNVNGIIKELQNGAQESIKATTEAGRLIVTTLDQADVALEELNGALSQMQKANDSIQNIAAVAEEQAASSKEMAHAIDSATRGSVQLASTVSNIQRATDETTQATEGVARQAEAMTASAHALTEILSMFKLEFLEHENHKNAKATAKPAKALRARA